MIEIKDQVPEIRMTKDQEDAALQEINYTREQLKLDLEIIKEWLKDQHHLPASRMKETDYFLMYFLTWSKGSLEKCKQTIETYYIAKKSAFFQNNDSLSEEQAKARDFSQFTFLPLATPTGMRVTFFRITGTFNHDFVNVFRHICHTMEVAFRLQEVSSRAFFLIADLKGATSEMITRMNPLLVKEIVTIIQDGYPSRIKKIVIMNTPHFVEMAYNYLLKPFLSKKLSNRLVVTSAGYEILANMLPQEVIPKEFGGEGESIKTIEEKWIIAVKSTRTQMLSEWSESMDDSKRPGDTKATSNPYLGIHGSIKKLCID